MPEKHSPARKYCADLVRARDEDRYLSAQYSQPVTRAKLIALYALHQEIRQIPGAVSEPPLGEIRLQWWRDAVAEIAAGAAIRAHPVVEYAAETNAINDANRSAIDAAIDARAHFLYKEPFASTDALFEWLDRSEGYLAIARQFDRRVGSDAGDKILIRAESAFVAARDATDLAPGLVDSAKALISAAYEQAKPILGAMTPEQGAPHLHLALTMSRLRARRAAPLLSRLRLFKAMATGRF